ncbi:MAG: cysteine--tRNA ligase [Fidelibacterota bacterium]
MALRFYNTLSRKKEPFIPIKPGRVTLYTCGPTVYDQAHIGNFRTFLFEDLLKRHLRLRGFTVVHVMNITDVDDKTIQRSRERKVSLKSLTEKHTADFFTDLRRLRIIPADYYPRATEHVADMIDTIQRLIARGVAYKTEDGSVWFSIAAYPEYGKLAHIKPGEMQTGERVQSDDYTKDNPMDFALWKSWKPEDGQVKWNSPWGPGRPGWHIECSVMSTKILGDEFDIHCGGVDNIFPHHENEIAQAVCATESNFARYWLHAEHLMVDGGKMSKSLGNFYRLSDLIDRGYEPEVIRFMLLNAHYRSKLNFSLSKYKESRAALERITSLRRRLRELQPDFNRGEGTVVTETGEAVLTAMDDDLDLPKALALLFDWVRAINVRLDQGKLGTDTIREARLTLDLIDRLFGWLPEVDEGQAPEEILALVAKRQEARKAKNWALADELRDQIKTLGWLVKDTPRGPQCVRETGK